MLEEMGLVNKSYWNSGLSQASPPCRLGSPTQAQAHMSWQHGRFNKPPKRDHTWFQPFISNKFEATSHAPNGPLGFIQVIKMYVEGGISSIYHWFTYLYWHQGTPEKKLDVLKHLVSGELQLKFHEDLSSHSKGTEIQLIFHWMFWIVFRGPFWWV